MGRTGCRVSALGFGGSPLGGMFGPIDVDEGIAAVREAVDAGINYFDVSPYYGNAEEVLGRALEGRRDAVILGTKAGRYPEGFDFRAGRIRTSVEESLRRLKTDHVDLLLAHDVEFGDLSQIFTETWTALLGLKAEGKCRWIGMSGYPLATLRRGVAACEMDVALSYCHLCLCDTTLATGLAPQASARGVGLANASPLSMGLLTDAGPGDNHPAQPALRAAARRAATTCHERGASLSRLALEYALWLASAEPPLVATTLVGMSTRDQVRRNLDALAAQPDPGLLAAVQSALAGVKDTVWPSGRRENAEDPEGDGC